MFQLKKNLFELINIDENFNDIYDLDKESFNMYLFIYSYIYGFKNTESIFNNENLKNRLYLKKKLVEIKSLYDHSLPFIFINLNTGIFLIFNKHFLYVQT
jgi:hypothetical protein